MTKVMMILAALLMTGSFAMAEGDSKAKDDTSTKVSENPITGTKKTVVKKKVAQKNAAGDSVSATTETTTKEYKDGTVKKSSETDVKSEKK